MSGIDRTCSEDGFTLVEVLVAFAIAAVALSGLYTAIGMAARSDRVLAQRVQAAQAAQSALDRLVAGRPEIGERRWVDADGFVYVARTQPLVRLSARPDVRSQPVRIELSVSAAAGPPLVILTTVSFASVAP